MNLRMKVIFSAVLTTITISTVACNILAQPTQTQTAKETTSYNVTAAPTIFAKHPQTIPSVKLNWAYANQQLLKIDITLTGLDANANIEELICDPFLVTKEPIQYSPPGRDVKHLSDQPGNALELTYEYNLNPSIQYKSLDIDMDVTIGPCANSLNFQESNVTPSVIPDLIGNYHFSFQVPVQ